MKKCNFPDLVAYSSTVIPLKSYEVSYNIGGKIDNEEYKEAYLKHLHKKVKHQDERPGTLITRTYTMTITNLS